jgi:hypothetical protein
MKTRKRIFLFAIVFLMLATVDSAGAQVRRAMKSAEILAALKPGQWAQLEGIVQKDFSVLCSEVKIFTGDIQDDDWGLTGLLRKIDSQKGEVKILTVPIKFRKGVKFRSGGKQLKSVDDLEIGMLAKVKGTHENGYFLAKKFKDQSGKLANEPGLKQEIEAEGKVQNIDHNRQMITLMGIRFKLTDRTQGKMAVK